MSGSCSKKILDFQDYLLHSYIRLQFYQYTLYLNFTNNKLSIFLKNYSFDYNASYFEKQFNQLTPSKREYWDIAEQSLND